MTTPDIDPSLQKSIVQGLAEIGEIDQIKKENTNNRVEETKNASEAITQTTLQFQEKVGQIVDIVRVASKKISPGRSFRIGSVPKYGEHSGTDIDIYIDDEGRPLVRVTEPKSNEKKYYQKIELDDYLGKLPADTSEALKASLRINATDRNEIFMQKNATTDDFLVEQYDTSLPAILQEASINHFNDDFSAVVKRDTAGHKPGTLFDFQDMARGSKARTINDLLDPAARLSVSIDSAKK